MILQIIVGPLHKLFEGENKEAVLDVLLVCANKPVNYSNLNELGFYDLWNIAKSFAEARDHDRDKIRSAIQTILGAVMDETLPEVIGLGVIGLGDIEVQQTGLTRSELYYAREEIFQDMIYKEAKDRIWHSIHDTLGFPVKKARQRECQIVRTYLQYLNDMLFTNQSIAWISIDRDKFKHYYNQIYSKEMPAEITRTLILEVLQMARLGYEHEGRFYPFWYTVRKDIGPEFRKTLEASLTKGPD